MWPSATIWGTSWEVPKFRFLISSRFCTQFDAKMINLWLSYQMFQHWYVWKHSKQLCRDLALKNCNLHATVWANQETHVA